MDMFFDSAVCMVVLLELTPQAGMHGRSRSIRCWGRNSIICQDDTTGSLDAREETLLSAQAVKMLVLAINSVDSSYRPPSVLI
jgi:hypothetical protein